MDEITPVLAFSECQLRGLCSTVLVHHLVLEFTLEATLNEHVILPEHTELDYIGVLHHSHSSECEYLWEGLRCTVRSPH